MPPGLALRGRSPKSPGGQRPKSHGPRLKLPLPTDPRALRIAEALRNNPSDNITLDELSRNAGASKRTIERLFQTETDLTFGKWRQQMRLMHALRLLALGESVTAAALEVGYDSTSAFIAAFKSVLGTTPGQYYTDTQTRSLGGVDARR